MRSSFRSTRAAAAALAAVLVAAAPPQRLPARLPPIDQCGDDDSFLLFRETLESAAAREDSKSLAPLFAPELRTGSNDPHKISAEDWDPNGPGPEGYWEQLHMLLRIGCVREGDARIFPSTPAQLKRYPKESLRKKILILPGADLLKETGNWNSVVDGRVLKWDVATITNNSGDFWTGVRLRDGRTGWIGDTEFYDLEYQSKITIEKRDGQWMITKFD